MKLVNFLRSEDGAVSVDWTVLVAAVMGVGLVVSAEVARGLEAVTDDYDGINTGEGIMTMFVNAPNVPTETLILTDDPATGGETAADDTMECNAANPGNDKCVGKAGETPNGDLDGWGSGSQGQGDVNAQSGNGKSNNGKSNGKGNGKGNS